MVRPVSFVLIPGGWHRPTCYDKIIKLLEEQHGFKCVPETLPSTMGDPNKTFKDDYDAARNLITAELALERDVVVIAHSYGGVVGNSAIRDLTPPRNHVNSSVREAAVIGLVLISSGFTLTGVGFMDPFRGKPPPSWKVNRETGFAELTVSPIEFFYHDIPSEEAEFRVSQLAPQSWRAFYEDGPYAYAGWKDVPVWYVGSVQDRGLPVVVQRLQVGMARGMGGSVVHVEMNTSHSPFVSRPNELVEILLVATRSFQSKSMPPTAMKIGGSTFPSLKLLDHHTWTKYGLPLGVGRVLGWIILAVIWIYRLWSPHQKTQ